MPTATSEFVVSKRRMIKDYCPACWTLYFRCDECDAERICGCEHDCREVQKQQEGYGHGV